MNHTASRRTFLQHSVSAALLAANQESALNDILPEDWLTLSESSNVATAANDEEYWRLVKRQFFIEDGLTYLNSGTYGPTLRTAYDSVSGTMRDFGTNYIKTFRATLTGDAVPKFIGKLAAFAGAKPDEIALTSGTTEAMNYIANGLDLKAGDEILTTRHEHQGGLYPWLLKAKRHGVVVKQIDLASPAVSHADILERLSKAFTPRTRVLSFSHINYTDGSLMPARELCQLARERGVISVVDGAQSLGMLDFKISDLNCDFFAASWHKWMCAPYGTGLLFVRDEMRDRLWPTTVLSYSGWDTQDRDGNDASVTDITYAGNYPKALLKYSSNIEYFGPLYWAIAHVVDFNQLIGRAHVAARIKTLAERAYTGLREIPNVKVYSPSDAALRTGLISFQPQGISTSDLYFKMTNEMRIVGRFVKHAGIGFDVNRFSTNIFNTPEQVDAAVAAVRANVKA